MRISSILIENFKSIKFLEVKNLPNFIVIAGENGVGKSSLFEAIVFFKSSIGPYSYQERNLWDQKRKDLIKIGEKTMKIALELEATTDQERGILQNDKVTAEISYTRDPESWNVSQSNLNSIFSTWSRETPGIGGFELIPANRTFMEGPLQLQYQNTIGEDFLIRRVSQMVNKFHDAKQRFANFLLHDKILQDESQIFPGIRNLVEGLIGRKIEIKFNKQTLAPSIMVEVNGGLVDIDTLSSGQRELFMTFVSIQSLGLSNSIILFDEPDLHLHATLQKNVMKFLKDMTNHGNQIFIATHSVEMISETSTNNLYHLSQFQGNSQLQNIEKEKEKVDIFHLLGASKYTFLNFKKVVFLEGPSDYQLLKNATNPNYGLRFQYIRGVNIVTPEILEKASRIDSFFMIRDRDFYTENELLKDASKYGDRVKFLKRRQIENYILDDDGLFDVIKKIGIDGFAYKSDLLNKLYEISVELFEHTLVDYYLYKNSKNIHPPRLSLNNNEKAEDGLEQMLKLRSDRFEESKRTLRTEISRIRLDLSNNWKENWIIYCNGKEVLRRFLNIFHSNKSFEDLRTMVSIIWDSKQYLPKDIEKIMKEISDAN